VTIHTLKKSKKLLMEMGDRMKVLILVHVLAAIIGIGPTYFGHILLRKNQSVQQLKHGIVLMAKLSYFPKVGGTLAVLTGILLAIFGPYSFMQLWLVGSLVLYIIIQIIVIGLMDPVSKKLASWVLDPANADADKLPEEQNNQLIKVNNLFYSASAVGLLLFIFMIWKPVL
jgi:uncharacterized membrane protein